MRLLTTSMLAIAAVAAAPASAAVLGFSGVALGTTPTTFSFAPGSSFSLSYDAAAASNFDTSPYALSTSGTGESSLTFGAPSSFFPRSGITIDGSLFPGFGPVPTATDIPFSITPTDLALRYSVGSDVYYGYARLVDGNVDIAFESQANTAIVAGSAIVGAPAAVPEPATWAMMIGGFGLVGSAMRRRVRPLAAA